MQRTNKQHTTVAYFTKEFNGGANNMDDTNH